MLQTIRERASGWIAKVIMALLIIPFAIWGINSYFGPENPLDAAEVNGTSITLREFQQAFQQQRQRLQQLLNSNLLSEQQLKQEVLEQLVTERVLNLTARELGMRVGDRQLGEAIAANPAFQVDGRFDQQAYERVLNSQGYTPVAFEEAMRAALVTEQLRDGLADSLALTQAEQERLVALLRQQRKLSFVLFDPAQYRDKVQVDDAAIQAYYQEHKASLQSPEQVRVQYVELALDALAGRIQVGEEALRDAYKQQLSQFGQPEERKASQILVTLPENADQAAVAAARAQAESIYARIKDGGEAFQQAMNEYAKGSEPGVQAEDLGNISQGMLDKAFDDALFALKNVGEVSAPVQTRFGFHIIRLDGITPGQVKPFDEVREELARQLRRHEAETQFYDAAEKLSTLVFENPDSLEPVTKELGLSVQESGWFGRSGGEGIAARPKVTEAAFGEDVLNRGVNSEVIELEPGRVVVLRLLEHKQPATLTLEEAREQVVQALKDKQARELLEADAKALLEKAQAGEDLALLAGRYPVTFKSVGLVRRDDATVDPAILAEAFRLPQPGVGQPSLGSVALADGGQAVVAVSEVVSGKLDELSEEERKQLQRGLTAQLGGGEFEAFLKSLRTRAEVRTFTDRL
ncbi:MAG TPA: SurA N-terminal domain-containing protein [Candidatus Competibacteraceae bacterium]|nr:SurA N-terminal domain-containing protein [Candidatus Competibacteraceae bacterium]